MAGQGPRGPAPRPSRPGAANFKTQHLTTDFSGCFREPSVAAVTTVPAGVVVLENPGKGRKSAGRGAGVVGRAREVVTGAAQLAAPCPRPPRPSLTLHNLQHFIVIPYITLLHVSVSFSPHLIVYLSSFGCCEASTVVPMGNNHIIPNAQCSKVLMGSERGRNHPVCERYPPHCILAVGDQVRFDSVRYG